ncbi:peptidoglycan-binding domain-containing protein [Paucidesulfovibrio longus]|uniref:peptidoglycan-binding domain-containing protein n=1 Tax=Paucidesulfovibrio longus TaxID=889 RepID=UPI0003B7983D|nr:peptidoglycan-binding domain-containing protein [Paucidesulfovibrio longus]
MLRRHTFILALAILAALLPLRAMLHSPAASAQTPPPATQSAEQARELRNKGFSLMRADRTQEALDAYRDSLRHEDDETVRAIVRKLEAQLEKAKTAPAPEQSPAPRPPAPNMAEPNMAAPKAPPAGDANLETARELRRQAFTLSSQGRTGEAAELYRQSLRYEDSPQVRMILSRMEQAEARKAQARDQERRQRELSDRHAPGMTAAQIHDAQAGLASLGYDPGPADGIMGERTVQALRDFQRNQGLAQDGVLSILLAAKIQEAPVRTAQAQAAPNPPGPPPAPAPAPPASALPAPGAPPAPASAPPVAAPAPPSAIPADCEQGEAALTAEIERLMSQSDSLGICMSAKEYQRVMRESAALMRRCPQMDPDGAQAREYDRVAKDTQQTIDASCQ